MPYAATTTTSNDAATWTAAPRGGLAMSTHLRASDAATVGSAWFPRCVRCSLSVGDLHCAEVSGKEAINVSCSIRDSNGLFDLALDAGGFSKPNGEMPLVARHAVLERSTIKTFLQLLAVAHMKFEPAYSE